MGRESKRYRRKTLLAVLNDPNASPRDRLLASAGFERITYEPRGRHVAKAKSQQNTPDAAKPGTTHRTSPASVESGRSYTNAHRNR